MRVNTLLRALLWPRDRTAAESIFMAALSNEYFAEASQSYLGDQKKRFVLEKEQYLLPGTVLRVLEVSGGAITQLKGELDGANAVRRQMPMPVSVILDSVLRGKRKHSPNSQCCLILKYNVRNPLRVYCLDTHEAKVLGDRILIFKALAQLQQQQ